MAYKAPLLTNTYDVDGNEIEINNGSDKIVLTLQETLGEGAFAFVYKGVDIRGKPFAVKTIACHDKNAYYSIVHEIDILLKLRNENLVRMYAFDFINATAVLVMEYCENGTLNDRLITPVDSKLQFKWLEQLAAGLFYLHSSDIVHRDLKTENVLITGQNDIKISDFGISREFLCVKDGGTFNRDETYLSQYLHAYMGTFAGTPFWVAPEVFDLKYNEKADIFSLGVIFHSILERAWREFDDHKYYGVFVNHYSEMVGIGLAMFEKKRYIEPTFTTVKSKKLQVLIINMLSYNPEERNTLETIRIHINDAFEDLLQYNEDNQKEEEEKEGLIGALVKKLCCCFNCCCY